MNILDLNCPSNHAAKVGFIKLKSKLGQLYCQIASKPGASLNDINVVDINSKV